ncbi:MAG: RsbRD N-terminal domain-containing protein [Candidatus Rokubacteria bacterium]|nr:RsbRD N-terminal domain-containing protein [Candidatus Rokubacteria bacterium]
MAARGDGARAGADGARPLMGALAARKDALVSRWLARTLETYPERTARFLAQERDPFRNPVGQALKEALPGLLDELLGAMDAGRLAALLDGIVRIRAVQDFTAGQAVAFVFLLKRVIRDALAHEIRQHAEGAELAAVEGRIDEMALLAFDQFMRCRERLYEIKAAQAGRSTALLARMRERARP